MDPDLGAMDCGAELTRLDATDHGAEMVQFLAHVCERGVRRGQGVGADPRRPDPRRRGAFIARPLPSRTFLGFSLPPVPPLLRLHISIRKI
jgi:hypothetical protein